MSFLNPWFLAAAVSVAVPVVLHLFQQRRTARLSFPALRYLERTEREHSREIRFRQILLLLARVLALVLLVAAGARPFLSAPGSAHPPTAVVIVLDNSMSTGLVVDEERVLDVLKRVAERSLRAATPDDLVWVIRAGEPWRPAVPQSPADGRRTVRETRVSHARGDLSASLDRAEDLLATSEYQSREIHLITDLQRSGFSARDAQPASVPVTVWTRTPEATDNHAVVEAVVAGGLPPIQGQSAEISVRIAGPEGGDPIGVRALVDGRVRAAANLAPGNATTLTLPPSDTAWVVGTVAIDPDQLSIDDRRYFAYRSRPAPATAVRGDPDRFVLEAMAVLEEAGRVRTGSIGPPDVTIAVTGNGLQGLSAGSAALVLPPVDPTLRPALNRRLRDAGIPWSYGERTVSGAAELTGPDLPSGLAETTVERWFELQASDDARVPSRVLAEIAGTPWAVETETASGHEVLLLASPLDAGSSSLPLSPGLVRFLDWVAVGWAGAGRTNPGHLTGERIPAPRGATHVRTPDGARLEIDGTRSVATTGISGHYTFLEEDSVVAVASVNPPAAESDLHPLDASLARERIARDVTVASDLEAWSDEIFHDRRGPELWWVLLLLAVFVLLAEPVLAAAGRVRIPKQANRNHMPAPHGAP